MAPKGGRWVKNLCARKGRWHGRKGRSDVIPEVFAK